MCCRVFSRLALGGPCFAPRPMQILWAIDPMMTEPRGTLCLLGRRRLPKPRSKAQGVAMAVPWGRLRGCTTPRDVQSPLWPPTAPPRSPAAPSPKKKSLRSALSALGTNTCCSTMPMTRGDLATDPHVCLQIFPSPQVSVRPWVGPPTPFPPPPSFARPSTSTRPQRIDRRVIGDADAAV